MSTIYKFVRSAIPLQIKTKLYLFPYVTNFTDQCGSSSGGDSKCPGSDEGKNDTPCFLGPSSGDSDNPGAPTMYDSRKLGHKLSTNNVCPSFETLPNIPTGVFRCTAGEVLGRGAGKCTYYQNPEYYSYHHMSFYDFNIALRQYRRACPKTGRKPV